MESRAFISGNLGRKVQIDLYYTPGIDPEETTLLLFNDGQILRKMEVQKLLQQMAYTEQAIKPLTIIGIHAGQSRQQEYGTAGSPDFKGRGTRATRYTAFVLEELLPYLQQKLGIREKSEKAFAGFSLGGLSALDNVWNHPEIFSKAGVFSGSLWWRSRGLEDGYTEATDRIMHNRIREGRAAKNLNFFFSCGTKDEESDRNNNGIIDSIEDTLDLIDELKLKGYNYPDDIFYLEMAEGRHNPATWKEALPQFLYWGWAKKNKSEMKA